MDSGCQKGPKQWPSICRIASHTLSQSSATLISQYSSFRKKIFPNATHVCIQNQYLEKKKSMTSERSVVFLMLIFYLNKRILFWNPAKWLLDEYTVSDVTVICAIILTQQQQMSPVLMSEEWHCTNLCSKQTAQLISNQLIL